ncbi:flagellar basal body rod protein FlgG [Salipaludibacillus keqinensis]|uniref:Flagellar hook protein FlgE n=1 Tax=Salipaludibacillus keqinensis TaxID=2045207 RepID=A0A323TEU8_9BACI|nr:flagellar basal body rod protein FlgG [Salipaludibacillus keqinensis]PYZ93140.1 flagellar basal body rod protein FlgG [Salipaludibacillus keqinensis]
MIRSLYSGIGGMNNFQNKLDVIGNNIANVNTFGFKKGRATFNDLVSQQMAGASTAVDGGRGGTNPMQIGLGGGMSSVDTINTQGSLQSTGRDLDIAISGDGYFVLSEEDGGGDVYTRAGNFYLDSNGTMVNADGLRVMDVGGNTIQIEIGQPAGNPLESFNISPTGEINGVFADGTVDVLSNIAIANFNNPAGLNKAGGNTYEATNNSGAPQVGLPGVEGRGNLVGSTLEMSNVDLSEEFAEMIVSQRGFQANTRMITTSDEILQELVNLKR